MREDRQLDFAGRYTAAWCSQDAASVVQAMPTASRPVLYFAATELRS